MNKHGRFEAARKIAEIRLLQLDRARSDTQRSVVALKRTREQEHSASANLDAHLDGWRNALSTPAGISPSLAMNWFGAVASVRATYLQARQATLDATIRVNEQRIAMTRCEQQTEHATVMVERTKRRFEREREEQQANRIEDLYLSQERNS